MIYRVINIDSGKWWLIDGLAPRKVIETISLRYQQETCRLFALRENILPVLAKAQYLDGIEGLFLFEVESQA